MPAAPGAVTPAPSGAASLTASPAGWDWPYQITLPETQQIVDGQAIRVLEAAPAEFRLAWQTRQLRRLLAFAHGQSAFWHAALTPHVVGQGRGHGNASFAVDAANVGALPLLDRAAFRARVESEGALAVPPSHGKTVASSTSGSTGMPVKFFITELAQRLVRHHYWADHARLSRDMFRLWAVVGPQIPAHPGQEHVRVAGQPWLGESDGIARHSVGVPMDELAAWVSRVAPAYLFISPVLFSGLLDAWEAGVAPPVGLEQIGTLAATVEPALRERTRRVTGARIVDRYSCEEIGPVALQCPVDDARYHVCVANTLVEVVDDAGHALPEGEIGRVLITGLNHWACPVIRYDVGDVAALHATCTCGAQVPSLSRLLGRKRALLRTPSGQSRFVRLTGKDWLNVADVREYRVLQVSAQTLRVELVLPAPITDAERGAVLTMLREKVDPEFMFDIVQVKAIAWPMGAKRQDVVGLGWA